MTFSTQADSGEVDDRVKIAIGPNMDVRVFTEYSVHSSIFQQPSKWTVRLSPGRKAKDILKAYQPGNRFALYIGPYRQFTGEIDAPNADGDASVTNIQLVGRDVMQRLEGTDIPDERSFHDATFEELFKAALKDVGFGHKIVEISNKANQRIKTGVGVKLFAEPITVDEVRQTPSGPGFRNVVTARLGESWLHFLERHFKKIGLFAWSDANGNFVLSRPAGDQEAMFHFLRMPNRRGNVRKFSLINDTTRRWGHCVVFARNHGGKHGHNHTNGGFRDEEMIKLGFEWKRRVYRDAAVTNEKEAKAYAQWKIAEANRASFKLQYEISGHSAPTMKSFGGVRSVICPDLVARVDDDVLGIHEDMYIESCEYRASGTGPRTTLVTLMRIKDLIFGDE